MIIKSKILNALEALCTPEVTARARIEGALIDHALGVALCHAQLRDIALCTAMELTPVQAGDKRSAPTELQLIPAGTFIGRDGRKWKNGNPDQIVAAYNRSSIKAPIDYEHATETSAAEGFAAPAAAWIEKLFTKDGAIWGNVSWTPAGEQAVLNREWRYYSPAFRDDNKGQGGNVTGFLSAALTNKPNLEFETALNRNQENTVDPILKALLAALGLATDGSITETQAVAALNSIKSERDVALNRANTPDLNKFVPRADHDAALNRAVMAENKLKERDTADLEAQITAAVDGALGEGKIVPATRDFYVAMCREKGGLEKFKDFVTKQPKIAEPSNLDSRRPAGGGDAALNSEQSQIMKALGNTPEDLKKYAGRASA